VDCDSPKGKARELYPERVWDEAAFHRMCRQMQKVGAEPISSVQTHGNHGGYSIQFAIPLDLWPADNSIFGNRLFEGRNVTLLGSTSNGYRLIPPSKVIDSVSGLPYQWIDRYGGLPEYCDLVRQIESNDIDGGVLRKNARRLFEWFRGLPLASGKKEPVPDPSEKGLTPKYTSEKESRCGNNKSLLNSHIDKETVDLRGVAPVSGIESKNGPVQDGPEFYDSVIEVNTWRETEATPDLFIYLIRKQQAQLYDGRTHVTNGGGTPRSYGIRDPLRHENNASFHLSYSPKGQSYRLFNERDEKGPLASMTVVEFFAQTQGADLTEPLTGKTWAAWRDQLFDELNIWTRKAVKVREQVKSCGWRKGNGLLAQVYRVACEAILDSLRRQRTPMVTQEYLKTLIPELTGDLAKRALRLLDCLGLVKAGETIPGYGRAKERELRFDTVGGVDMVMEIVGISPDDPATWHKIATSDCKSTMAELVTAYKERRLVSLQVRGGAPLARGMYPTKRLTTPGTIKSAAAHFTFYLENSFTGDDSAIYSIGSKVSRMATGPPVGRYPVFDGLVTTVNPA
jgi:hypothetical protein